MFENLTDSQLSKTVFSVLVLMVAYATTSLAKKSMRVVLSHDKILGRTKTITSLLNSGIDIVVFLIALLIILSHWDVDILPLLTGAGIAGLALSFGAQTLVKDIISGFFILLEDQLSVGDTVKIANMKGTVVRVTLRLTVLEDKDKNLVYIPNSQITTVLRYKSEKN